MDQERQSGRPEGADPAAATGKPLKVTLSDMLAAYDPEKHRHDEIDWGPPVGSEVW